MLRLLQVTWAQVAAVAPPTANRRASRLQRVSRLRANRTVQPWRRAGAGKRVAGASPWPRGLFEEKSQLFEVDAQVDVLQGHVGARFDADGGEVQDAADARVSQGVVVD